MFKILKQTQLSKGTKIALIIWLTLFIVVWIIFGILHFMSKDRIDYAKMVVDSEIFPTIEQCRAECNEASRINTKNLAFLHSCQQACEKSGAEIHTYRIKLLFDSQIFKAHRFYSNITLKDIQWNKEIDKLGGVISTHQTAKDNDFIEIKVPYQLQLGQNIGILSYTTEFLSLLLEDYAGRLIFILAFCVMLWFFFIPLKTYIHDFNTMYPKQNNIKQTTLLPTFNAKDRIFLVLSGLLIIIFGIFQFWLGYPGYHIIGDTYITVRLGTTNFAPVLPSYVLGILYFFFGKHLYYLFLLNLIPFYVGLLFLVWGFYIRFRSMFAIVLLFPIFIGNIYFQNFIALTSSSLPMLLFCGYAMVLFALLVPLSQRKTKILWWMIGVVFFLAILWRHNAIFSVFPIGFTLIYLWLCNRNLNTKTFVIKYIKSIIAFAFMCVCIVVIVSRNLTFPRSALPANHVFLHQIAGACIPADDSSCFKQEWYYPNKDWNDVKELYAIHPLFADPFTSWNWRPERPFPDGQLDRLYTQWIKAISKYPVNFIKHELRFLKAMWIQMPDYMFDSKALQDKPMNKFYVEIVNTFPENERSITFTPMREKIYSFLYEHRLLLNHMWGVLLSFSIMILSCIVWLWKQQMRNALLMFSFSVAFAGFFSALFIVLFTPATISRYMSPILPLGIIACIGFMAFIIDWRKIKNM